MSEALVIAYMGGFFIALMLCLSPFFIFLVKQYDSIKDDIRNLSFEVKKIKDENSKLEQIMIYEISSLKNGFQAKRNPRKTNP